MRVCVAMLALCAVAATASAQSASVALLPLDADARLEIYGQPVASEIARALVAGGIDVVVVGPKMAVPERARLVVDGSIRAKGDAVTLAIRVRNPIAGTTLEKLEETAASLGTIDRAAAQLSARVLPLVRDQLVKVMQEPRIDVVRPPKVVVPVPQPKPPKTLLVGVSGESAALRGALDALGPTLAARSPWRTVTVEAKTLARTQAPRTVTTAGADAAMSLEILDYEVFALQPKECDGCTIPLGRARVRVRIADRGTVKFERVVYTDSVVCDRDLPLDGVARQVALEVIAILRPHLRRAEVAW